MSIDTDPAAVPKVRKPRAVKVKPERKPRTNPIVEAFGERGVVAAKVLPKADRKALVNALKLSTRDVTPLTTKVAALHAKIDAIDGASGIVATFKTKLQRIADMIDGKETV